MSQPIPYVVDYATLDLLVQNGKNRATTLEGIKLIGSEPKWIEGRLFDGQNNKNETTGIDILLGKKAQAEYEENYLAHGLEYADAQLSAKVMDAMLEKGFATYSATEKKYTLTSEFVAAFKPIISQDKKDFNVENDADLAAVQKAALEKAVFMGFSVAATFAASQRLREPAAVKARDLVPKLESLVQKEQNEKAIEKLSEHLKASGFDIVVQNPKMQYGQLVFDIILSKETNERLAKSGIPLTTLFAGEINEEGKTICSGVDASTLSNLFADKIARDLNADDPTKFKRVDQRMEEVFSSPEAVKQFNTACDVFCGELERQAWIDHNVNLVEIIDHEKFPAATIMPKPSSSDIVKTVHEEKKAQLETLKTLYKETVKHKISDELAQSLPPKEIAARVIVGHKAISTAITEAKENAPPAQRSFFERMSEKFPTLAKIVGKIFGIKSSETQIESAEKMFDVTMRALR